MVKTAKLKAKKNAAGIDSKLYRTTGLPKKQVPKLIRDRTKYEMILLCLNTRQPFTTQKLAFNASRNIAKAWQEAMEIRRLLVRVGDFKLRDIKIIAFGVIGALAAYQQEYHIKINRDSKVLAIAIQQIKRRI
ncbi:MAG TPA: hypothetical protein VNX68_09545 [Nitrosopumilaceae archaeon]|jgi:hypothetical protein|nr:hypothetical protein [Nitrosopumilaceae archaeon]